MDIQEKNNNSDNGFSNVIIPESLERKSDRIFIHQEKKRQEPELSDDMHIQ